MNSGSGLSECPATRLLQNVSGWLLLLAVCYIPWHAGGIAPNATTHTAAILLIAGMAWIGTCITERRLPKIPLFCLIAILLLLIQGTWMTLNAHHRYDPIERKFFSIANFWPAAPGSMDAEVSRTSVLNTLCMLVSLAIACDLAGAPFWRRRFCYVLALSGSVIAIYGVSQRLGIAPNPQFSGLPNEGTAFATFGYHANAGAFLNLCLPAAFVMMIVELRGAQRVSRKLLASLPFFVLLVGCLVNVSRAAQAITLMITAGLICWAVAKRPGNFRARAPNRSGGIKRFAVPLVACIIIGGVAMMTTWSRWSQIPKLLDSKNPRLLLWRICAHYVPEAGSLGLGPGTYKLIYPNAPIELLRDLYSRHIVKPHVPGQPVSMWNQAHQDYLQLAFEWGWIGAILWAAVLFGGLGQVLVAGRSALRGNFDGALSVATALAIAGVLIHALMDFPLQVLSIQVYVGIWLGLGWSSRSWSVQSRDLRRSTLRRHTSTESDPPTTHTRQSCHSKQQDA